jgi:two-component system NtrC family sensor kinase
MPWIHRAFVVNDWYIAAYEPIKNTKEEIIGVLYVGILEEKFTDMRKRAIGMFLGITLAGMFIALAVSSFLAKRVLKPVRSLVSASQQLAEGNLECEVKLESRDEIGELGEAFNLMASSLRQRDQRLKEYTQQQIVKSERLATIGQLAAGVAHEINNPLGAVLMYSHLCLEEMEAEDSRRKNLENVVREATRCQSIVKGLLDFARQTEPKTEESDANEILKRTLSLVENQVLFQNVKITKVLARSLPKSMMDSGQIQQVFTNIILNAAEAIDGEGELIVATRVAPDGESIEIEFTDTGRGIAQENLEKIFDPFFTTKEVGHGTGLGLSVSYGIVARHKGTISVKSEPGKGTTFVVRLPVRAEA